MNLPAMTDLARAVVPVVTRPAGSSLLWLIIALPALGAAVLLLGGQRTDAWGHLLGCATRRSASFVARPGRCSSDARPRDEDRQISQNLCDVDRAPASCDVEFDLLFDPLSALFVLLITGVGGADPHLLDRLHGARRAPPAVLRLPQPVRRRDAAAGARLDYLGAVPRLGGRRPGVVPADRLLAAQALRGRRRQEGVRVNRVGDIGLSLGIMPDVHRPSARRRSRRLGRRRARRDDGADRARPAAAARRPAASPRSSRCRPGCSTRWRARPRSRR